ncbi:hypothetical protein Aperf_G00000127452 [Anoplocephala perfoliata]
MDIVSKFSDKIMTMIGNNTITDDYALYCLERLQNVEMTAKILKDTSVRIIVNLLRKRTTNREIIEQIAQLNSQWDSLIGESSPKSGTKRRSDKDSLQHAPEETKRIRRSSSNIKKNTEKPTLVCSSKPKPDSKKRTPIPEHIHAAVDQIRLKAREMIKKGLDSKVSPSGALESDALATEIEIAIYDTFKNTGSDYKQRVRTRVMNLKDEKNPELHWKVVMGDISPKRLAIMSSDEMASSTMKKLREEYRMAADDKILLSVRKAVVESDTLECIRCKQRKCTFNQMQTGNANRSTATFVHCKDCGHKWKNFVATVNQGLSSSSNVNLRNDPGMACQQVPLSEIKQEEQVMAEYEVFQYGGWHEYQFQNEIFVSVPSDHLSRFTQEELEIADILVNLAEQQPHYGGTSTVCNQPSRWPDA